MPKICENLDLEEIKHLMDRERIAMAYAPNRKAWIDAKRRWRKLKDEYDKRIGNQKRPLRK